MKEVSRAEGIEEVSRAEGIERPMDVTLLATMCRSASEEQWETWGQWLLTKGEQSNGRKMEITGNVNLKRGINHQKRTIE